MRRIVPALLFLAACPGSSYEPAGSLPVIVSVTVSPTEVRPRDATTIRWKVEGAETVALYKGDGALVREGLDPEGSLESGPLLDTTVFAIVAGNAAGKRGGSALVRVLYDPPVVSELSATPDEVERGESVTIAWTTSNADGVHLETVAGVVLIDSGEPVGNIRIAPDASTTYELTAFGKGGEATARVEVTVLGVPPTIDELFAQPVRIVVGASSTLHWQTSGASSVALTDRRGPLSQSPAGMLTVTPTVSTRYTLTAGNIDGVVTAEVEVVVGPPPDPPPSIDAFTASPLVFGGTGDIELRWSVRGVRKLELFANGQPVSGFPVIRNAPSPTDTSGTITATIGATTGFVLVAASNVDELTATELVVDGIAEVEPNDTAAEAQSLPGTIEVRGTTSTIADWFVVNVPADGSVEAETSFGPFTCPGDTRLFLIASDGVSPLAFDDDDGAGDCSLIDPTVDTSAAGLAAGQYYVRVEAMASFTYALRLVVRGPTCGNGTLEGNEQCDDAGQIGGDGCDATCRFELEPPITVPIGTASVSVGSGVFVVIPVDALGGQTLGAVTGDVGFSGCPVDTTLELLSPSFVSLGVTTTGVPGGVGPCAAILTPSRDRFALNLQAGRHYLIVRADNGAGSVQVGVALTNAVCGNGIAETRANEQCDDNNTLNGDGCSSSCQIEGTVINEVEPNDSQALATPSGLTGLGRVTIVAANDPVGDDDVYRIDVGAGQGFRLEARTYSTPGQPTGCDSATTDTRIFVERAGTEATAPQTGEIAFNDDIDNANNVWCSRIGSVFLNGGAAGASFFVRVQGWQDSAVTSYLLDLRLTP